MFTHLVQCNEALPCEPISIALYSLYSRSTSSVCAHSRETALALKWSMLEVQSESPSGHCLCDCVSATGVPGKTCRSCNFPTGCPGYLEKEAYLGRASTLIWKCTPSQGHLDPPPQLYTSQAEHRVVLLPLFEDPPFQGLFCLHLLLDPERHHGLCKIPQACCSLPGHRKRIASDFQCC